MAIPKSKLKWVVEVYDPIADVMIYVSEPMKEVEATDLMIQLDKKYPEYSVSSRGESI